MMLLIAIILLGHVHPVPPFLLPSDEELVEAVGEGADEVADLDRDAPSLYDRNRWQVQRNRRQGWEKFYRAHPEKHCPNCWRLPHGMDNYAEPPPGYRVRNGSSE